MRCVSAQPYGLVSAGFQGHTLLTEEATLQGWCEELFSQYGSASAMFQGVTVSTADGNPGGGVRSGSAQDSFTL